MSVLANNSCKNNANVIKIGTYIGNYTFILNMKTLLYDLAKVVFFE